MAKATCSSPVSVLDNGGCTGPVLLVLPEVAAYDSSGPIEGVNVSSVPVSVPALADEAGSSVPVLDEAGSVSPLADWLESVLLVVRNLKVPYYTVFH